MLLIDEKINIGDISYGITLSILCGESCVGISINSGADLVCYGRKSSF